MNISFKKKIVILTGCNGYLCKSIVNSSRFNLSSSLARELGSIPRSTNAPKIMSPLIPEKQSKYAIVNLFFLSCEKNVARLYYEIGCRSCIADLFGFGCYSCSFHFLHEAFRENEPENYRRSKTKFSKDDDII